MRRREKFVIFSILLSIALLLVQYVSLEWRYLAIFLFAIISYFMSAFTLSDDLQWYEWLTILPLPTMFTASMSLFYFLLPENILSKFFILFIFGIGIYAIYLTANIYSVAKGRTIQLLYAAHAIGMFFTLIISLLFTNTIFSLKLVFFLNAILVALVHYPLFLMFLWSINLPNHLSRELFFYSLIGTILITEFSLLMSLIPFPVWYSSLFIMVFLYICLGVMQSYLKGRLFRRTTQEYSLVAIFVVMLFIILFPYK